jgi:hypothetical protein
MEINAMKIRSHLIIFALIVVLPVLVFAGVMTALFWRQQRAAFEQWFLERVRAMSIALARELHGYTGALRVLTRSAYLRSGDMASFYEQAARVRAEQPTWATVVLTDHEGRQRINLRMPFGAPLPSGAPDPAAHAAALRTGLPVVSNLFKNPVSVSIAGCRHTASGHLPNGESVGKAGMPRGSDEQEL